MSYRVGIGGGMARLVLEWEAPAGMERDPEQGRHVPDGLLPAMQTPHTAPG